ncbi:hypothetical protein BC628DRAFT_1422241 [Trametes gibbosa]|nr:hypothetical protein BC628DRAFT_1422241 [Trametes gibbosa]
MYVRTPTSAGNQFSGVSQALSTPSDAPRSLNSDGAPSPVRAPNTPFTPYSPASPGQFTPATPFHQNGNYYQSHHVAYGLMTPPSSPNKVGRGQPDFCPVLDAKAQPIPFDVRIGIMLGPQHLNAPAINHPVYRLIVSIGGLFDVEIVGRTGHVPTVSDFMNQIVHTAARQHHALSRQHTFAGLTLRSLEPGVAICVLHLRNGP